MNVVFVTPDEPDEKRLLALAEEALEGGVDAVQLRLKGARSSSASKGPRRASFSRWPK